MPLQNRVTPFGDIEATPARGLFMGNRGGRIHTAHKTLTRSRYKSKAWIICTLTFRDWHREVMSEGYTELFFLDEATALAAGHRPCYLCQRNRAKAFAAVFGASRAPQIDAVLHAERRAAPPALRFKDANYPGAMILWNAQPWLVTNTVLRAWTHHGYTEERPHLSPQTGIQCLTPPATLRALKNGLTPAVHPSANL